MEPRDTEATALMLFMVPLGFLLDILAMVEVHPLIRTQIARDLLLLGMDGTEDPLAVQIQIPHRPVHPGELAVGQQLLLPSLIPVPLPVAEETADRPQARLQVLLLRVLHRMEVY